MLDFRCVISKTMFENMELVERGLGLGCCSACALGGAVRDPGAEPCNLSAVSYLASRHSIQIQPSGPPAKLN
jgi:hypothetical protein